MDRALFDKLFEMPVEKVKALKANLWDQWCWEEENNPAELLDQVKQIETYLKARQTMGLEK